MKLARLELSGFKSFAVPVELAFDEGVTAVVGPNGCGKSNISDAVRWVLGEQRTRLLRGLRMEDVIFHGSVKRKPVSLAEVSLIFDNGDGGLPIAYHEVAITRRLTRSGLSEYLINQSPVRLRDVQDLLRGTGLGSDAGVVMEAGMIDRLLSDSSELVVWGSGEQTRSFIHARDVAEGPHDEPALGQAAVGPVDEIAKRGEVAQEPYPPTPTGAPGS